MMDASPQYVQWTVKIVAVRVVEAAETLMLCPAAHGPSGYRNAMPAPVRKQVESYGTETVRYRRRPAPGAISRMEETWAWINAVDSPDDRSLLYDWARVKCSKGKSVARFARESGMSEKQLRNEIRRICAGIAARLNGTYQPHTTAEFLPSNDPTEIAVAARRRENSGISYWNEPGSRPRIDGALPKTRTVSR